MKESTYYELPLYEPNDNCSLIDGYNQAIIEIDKQLHQLQVAIESLSLSIKGV